MTRLSGWTPGEYRWESRGNAYRLVVARLPMGGVVLAFPDWFWCAEWATGGPPPSAEWLAEHRFSTRIGDCQGAAAGLESVWSTPAAAPVGDRGEPPAH